MKLQLQNVCITDNEIPILKNISFTLTKGHLVVLGANGSGKTMISRIISGNLTPDAGTILINGTRLQPSEIWKLKKDIGIVSPQILEEWTVTDKVQDVIVSGLFGSIGVLQQEKPANVEILKTFITKVGQKKHPEAAQTAQKWMQYFAIDHLKDHPILELSFGEQMRVLIARAMMIDPILLILDEPTSGLDLKGKAQFRKLIEELSKKTQIMYITHHLEELIPEMKQVLMLKEGEVFAYGSIEEVLTSKNISDCIDCNLEIIRIDNEYRIKYR